ncbi:MAG: radical SAM protein, partial [Proteobacteria bacterium]|nr:radical SAM protein [Pseudomonadota bacterium]
MTHTFELGPIRPPNEANSLLVRVTRNCPWNKCTFCPVYKGAKFSLREVDDIIGDIESMAALADDIEEQVQRVDWPEVRISPEGSQVAQFLFSGGKTAFLQDANSLILPVEQLVRVLRALRLSFPTLTRVTTYARAHTVLKRSPDDLLKLRQAGLDRIHIGLESGSDKVLTLVKKGITAAKHIEAGQRVKNAGIELSEYVMPGLGGRALSAEHASETARVLRAIDPHAIRFRTLAARGGPLAEQVQSGEFEPLGDVEVAAELSTLIAGLTDMTSAVYSDHILNLFEEVQGQLPQDQPAMVRVIDRFLSFEPQEQELYIVGRRLGLMRKLDDLSNPTSRVRAQQALEKIRRQFRGRRATEADSKHRFPV